MDDLITTSTTRRTGHKEIFLLLTTTVILIIFGEIFFRVYYLVLGKTIAADQTELCFKEMKKATTYVSVSPNNFTYKSEWGEDPLIGLIPKKNHNDTDKLILDLNGKNTTGIIYFHDQHNAQGLTNVEEFLIKKPKNVSIRIALFGDSFTCGAELPLKFNVASVLKELIQNSEVLNFCMVGHGIDHMYARYFIESKKYAPEVVIFNILVDDIRRPFDCPLLRPNLTILNRHLVIGQRQWPTLQDFYFKYTPPRYESYFLKHILWVYNKHTRLKQDMRKGIELFGVMMDELKTQTREQNSTLIISTIIEQEPTTLEVDTYKKMLEILKEKDINFLDTAEYFALQKRIYNNQSFYYIRGKDHFKHFSAIGNAVFAQGLKNVLEILRYLPPTPYYFFANFDDWALLYFIPEIQGHIQVIPAFDIQPTLEDIHFHLKENTTTQ